MKHLTINGTSIVCPKDMTQKEVNEYINYLKNKHPKQRLLRLKISIDGEHVDLEYELERVPFERIRRITGYLTGDTSTWNNAKTAELSDRVRHSTEEEKFRKPCNHKNETPFMTNQKRQCPKCGKVYFYDDKPIDWDKIRNFPETTKKRLD